MPWRSPPQSRSIECNGDLIAFFRNQRGWTQEEFAQKAGYTKRLIAKAEGNGSLSPDSIEVLAETLSSDAQQVLPEDLTTSPKDLATAFLHGYARHESELVPKCRHLFSDDFVGIFPGGPNGAPLAGTYNGVDAYDEFVKKFFEIFKRPNKTLAIESMVVTTNGNDAIVAAFDFLENEYIPPGLPPGQFLLKLIVSGGKITFVQHFFDMEAVSEVLSMWREKRQGKADLHNYQYAPMPKSDEQ